MGEGFFLGIASGKEELVRRNGVGERRYSHKPIT